MVNLNDENVIKLLDPQGTLSSTDQLIQQYKTAWKEVESLSITVDYSTRTSVVFCGMGASIYGGLVVKSLLGPQAPCPMEIVSDYHIPSYVNHDTVVVLTSYSGSTEEVLSCAQEALSKNAKLIILTKGGALAQFAKDHGVPSYIFDGKLNPAGVPRLGNGYTIVGLLGLLNKTRVIDLEEGEIAISLTRLSEKNAELKKTALSVSDKLLEKAPVIITAEHLSGNAHILRNQLHETSKSFASHFLIPDLNHHLMEGLAFPKDLPLYFIILNSPNFSPKNKKRIELTTEVIRKNNHPVYIFQTTGQSLYDDFFEMLNFGSFLTLYLGLRYEQNPAVNPWVDYFKKHLEE
ncbi:MAG TPA: SIS domain-containing protein [Patescibacteria group bacterium]|nr:SIS domain-containing protein [Patescibacteria group bacterium]